MLVNPLTALRNVFHDVFGIHEPDKAPPLRSVQALQGFDFHSAVAVDEALTEVAVAVCGHAVLKAKPEAITETLKAAILEEISHVRDATQQLDVVVIGSPHHRLDCFVCNNNKKRSANCVKLLQAYLQ